MKILIVSLLTKMEAKKVVLCVFSIFLPAIARSLDHNEIIKNLLTLGESELTIFKDDDCQISEILNPKKWEKTIKIFDINHLWNRVYKKPCPAWNDMEYILTPIYLINSDYRHQTILVSGQKCGQSDGHF